MRRTVRFHNKHIWLLLVLMLISTNLTFFLFDRITNIIAFEGSSNQGFVIETIPRPPKIYDYTVIAICRPDWIGIKTATLAQNLTTLLIWEYNSERDRNRLLDLILEHKIQKIIINGIPPGSDGLIHDVITYSPRTKVALMYYETPVETPGDIVVGQTLSDLIGAAKMGHLYQLGFVKAGLAEAFEELGLNNTYTVENLLSTDLPTGEIKLDDRSPHKTPFRIGIFLWFVTLEVPMTQLWAACLFEDAEIHMLEPPDPLYLEYCKAKIVVHGAASRPQMLDLISQMDLTMYVSLTEACPMTVLDSLRLGVPCLTSHGHTLFNDEPEIFRHLTVSEFNNPAAIRDQIQHIRSNYADIVGLLPDLVNQYAIRSMQSLQDFVWDGIAEPEGEHIRG